MLGRFFGPLTGLILIALAAIFWRTSLGFDLHLGPLGRLEDLLKGVLAATGAVILVTTLPPLIRALVAGTVFCTAPGSRGRGTNGLAGHARAKAAGSSAAASEAAIAGQIAASVAAAEAAAQRSSAVIIAQSRAPRQGAPEPRAGGYFA
jgi:hypothetical protein